MEGFQMLVLLIATITLVVALIFIGFTLSYSKNQSWPPMVPDCPDYWTMDGSGNNAQCVNIKNLGKCPPLNNQKYLTMDFNAPAFTGTNGLCAKYNWANKCNISWDGITYGVNNPCQTS